MKNALINLLLFFPMLVWAQNNPNHIITETSTDSVTFINFIEKVERDYSVHFFYNKAWVETLRVKQPTNRSTLSQLLAETFKVLPIKYLIDGTNVIITHNRPIIKSLPENFFVINDTTPSLLATDEPMIIKEQAKTIDTKHKTVTIGTPSQAVNGQNCTISGIVKNDEDGSPIAGATVYSKELGKGTHTDGNGYYTLSLPRGKHEIAYKFIGCEDLTVSVITHSSGNLNVDLKESAVHIKEITITSNKRNNVTNLNIGVQQMNMEEIKQLPAAFGEADIIKTALLLPGVQTVGEGASGFNVRGGGTDQNLVLLDDAPIFNTSHLFGFFSVFNPETIKDFKLYKSGIPANFGGRVSSVFDVSARQGNLRNHVISGGISPVTGKLTAEGPIIKDKLSYIIGGRSTYSDWILKKIDGSRFKNSNANFYDASIKLAYDINPKNSLSLTAYQSKDYFKLNSDTAYHYENQMARLHYKHFFNPETYAQISAIYSKYQYNITSNTLPTTAFSLKYNIDYQALKLSVHYFPQTKHSIVTGVEIARYNMTPGDFTPLSAESDIKELRLSQEKGIETGIYLNDEYKINPRLTLSAGIRYALFFALGPYKKYDYNPYVPRSVESRMDSTTYSNNQIVKTYGGPELRLSARYLLSSNSSVKLSYNRIYQFMHMLTNSAAISPTDVWKLCDAQIKPLKGDQVAIGFYRNIWGDAIEASVEAYYKKTQNSLDYKNGTELLLNKDLEVDLLSGTGRAYGIEFLIQKNKGALNGWLSYTYSKTELKVNGTFNEEKINNGHYYPANYDKPHNVNLVTNYKISRRINFSSTITYSTGHPITYPVAKYTFRDRQLIHYSMRNEYRIPNYFRWDISTTIYESLKANKQVHNSFSIGIYNLLGNNNVYSVFFKTTDRNVKGYKMSIFTKPIVNVTYNFRF
jgi:hypothetical protein